MKWHQSLALLSLHLCCILQSSESFSLRSSTGVSNKIINDRMRPLPKLKSTTEVAEVDLSNSYDVFTKGRPSIGSMPQFAIPGDSTVETTHQRVVVATHFLASAANIAIAGSLFQSTVLNSILQVIGTIVASIILGDFGTGVFHWSVDNYGSIKTPIFGSVCAAFQGHHDTPWTITFRPFANNVYKIAYATIPFLGLVTLLASVRIMNPPTTIFLTLFINWWLISQEFHKYSHMKNLPPIVRSLQNAGVILSRKEHGRHHLAPYEGHYCILTGICNNWLDKSQFFRRLEVIVYQLTGNKPNTWKQNEAVEKYALSLFNGESNQE